MTIAAFPEETVPTPAGKLAFTGNDSVWTAGAGGLLVAAGVVLAVAGRRRRTT